MRGILVAWCGAVAWSSAQHRWSGAAREEVSRSGVVWEELGVWTTRRDERLLERCSGVAESGRLTAVLGPSGSGKTTLLRALVKTTAGVDVRGRVRRADGGELGGLRHGDAALLSQDSELFGRLTAVELLRFAYEMRGATRSKARELSAQSLRRFGLEKAAGRPVGDSRSSASASGDRGGALSGGERRRLCVALELALTESSRPALLAADEATSGLDAVAAERVIATLRRYARDQGVPTVATLHQPSSRIWLQQVDDVVLLAPGGRVAYHGPAKDVKRHFAKLGVKLPPHTNPAEWLLDIATSDNIAAYCDAWQQQQRRRAAAPRAPEDRSERANRPRRASIVKRIALLFGRSLKQVARDKRVHLLRLLGTAGLGVFLAERYGCDTDGDKLDAACVADRVALLSFSVISMTTMSLVRALDLFAKERPVVGRERERGLYGGHEYVAAKALAEIPLDCAFAALHGATLTHCLRHSQGTQLRSHPALPLAAVAAASGTLGLAVGACAKSSEAAVAVGGPVMVVHMLTGIINPSGAHPPDHFGARFALLQTISPIRHAVVWLLRREFADAPLAPSPRHAGIGGLAFVRDGNTVLDRLGILPATSRLADPAAALVLLSASHLALAMAALTLADPVARHGRRFLLALASPVRALLRRRRLRRSARDDSDFDFDFSSS